jgi:hypothetical protein
VIVPLDAELALTVKGAAPVVFDEMGANTNAGTASCTVRLAVALVTEPAVLLTVTENCVPLFAVAVAGVVNDAFVAPEICAPFSNH